MEFGKVSVGFWMMYLGRMLDLGVEWIMECFWIMVWGKYVGPLGLKGFGKDLERTLEGF